MARTQLALDLAPGDDIDSRIPATSTEAANPANPPGRSCSMSTSPTLHSTPQRYFPDRWHPIATVEKGHHLALLDQIAAWCNDTLTRSQSSP